MKIYYDLETKEREKYVEEFKKTPVGNKMNKTKIAIDIIWLIFIIAMVATEILFAESEFDSIFLIFSAAQFLTLLVGGVYSVYFNINFTAWLKNKYDIKRW